MAFERSRPVNLLFANMDVCTTGVRQRERRAVPKGNTLNRGGLNEQIGTFAVQPYGVSETSKQSASRP